MIHHIASDLPRDKAFVSLPHQLMADQSIRDKSLFSACGNSLRERDSGTSSDEDDSSPTKSSRKRRLADSEGESESLGGSDVRPKPNEEPLFPAKLFAMLEECEKNDQTAVVSWGSDGSSSFCVHKKREFERSILPKHFKMTKYKSFTRQLHYYGFSWIKKGPDKGGYCHPNFLRTDPSKCSTMAFQRVKKPKNVDKSNERKLSAAASPNAPQEDPLFDHVDFNTFPISPYAADISAAQQPQMPSISAAQAMNLGLAVNPLSSMHMESSFVMEQKLNPHDELSAGRRKQAARNVGIEPEATWCTPTTALARSQPSSNEDEAFEPRTIEEMTTDPLMEQHWKKFKRSHE